MVGIPPVFRKGPGADPPLPADRRRRAIDRQATLHAARPAGADGKAPPGAHLRRGDGRGGRVCRRATFLPGNCPTRRSPARHGLRPRRDLPSTTPAAIADLKAIDRPHQGNSNAIERQARSGQANEPRIAESTRRWPRWRRSWPRRPRSTPRRWRIVEEIVQMRQKLNGDAEIAAKPPRWWPNGGRRRGRRRSRRGRGLDLRPAPARMRPPPCAILKGRDARTGGAEPRQPHGLCPCRRAGGGFRRLRLDRHSGRPHGEGRGADHAGAVRIPDRARHRSGSRPAR